MQMDIMKREQQEGIRINKYLSEAGICSRRAADREIENGNVWIDGRQAVNGDRVLPGMKVIFCGKEVHPETEEIMIAFHKPVGIVPVMHPPFAAHRRRSPVQADSSKSSDTCRFPGCNRVRLQSV